MTPHEPSPGAASTMRIILVVDDDPGTVKLLRLALEAEGYRVITAADGLAAVEAAQREHPSLVILDRRLPGLDGTEVCRRLRTTSDVPILMLTALADEVDKLVGFSLGADDYVTKPFSPREMVARVKAVLDRTARRPQEKALRHRDLHMDLERYRVSVRGREVPLTPSEFRLLRALLERPERVFSRDELLDQLYPQGQAAVVPRAIDVHMGNLRRKLGDDRAHPRLIATVRGVGYRLV